MNIWFCVCLVVLLTLMELYIFSLEPSDQYEYCIWVIIAWFGFLTSRRTPQPTMILLHLWKIWMFLKVYLLSTWLLFLQLISERSKPTGTYWTAVRCPAVPVSRPQCTEPRWGGGASGTSIQPRCGGEIVHYLECCFCCCRYECEGSTRRHCHRRNKWNWIWSGEKTCLSWHHCYYWLVFEHCHISEHSHIVSLTDFVDSFATTCLCLGSHSREEARRSIAEIRTESKSSKGRNSLPNKQVRFLSVKAERPCHPSRDNVMPGRGSA